jgi:diguanylate cyclase (GGDEF)-like protein
MDTDLASQTILIVDDNPTNLEVLSDTLTSNGFQVAVATDGESALEQVAYSQPGLILLDVMMSNLDGFETCRRFKTNPDLDDIPIIFITALSDTESKVKGFTLGAVDYITKPFQYEEVLARVKVHLQLRFLTRTVQEQAIALQKINQELENLANLDSLTGLANRRRFDQHLEQGWQRQMEKQQPLSLILCDIDYFKPYNDYYGHQAGDTCLRQVAQAISLLIKRPTDLVARYGGEELAVTLPNVALAEAVQIAESIRLKVKQLKIPHAHSKASPYITLSLGVSSQIPTKRSQALSLVATADKALYLAKERGRDNWVALQNPQESAIYFYVT